MAVRQRSTLKNAAGPAAMKVGTARAAADAAASADGQVKSAGRVLDIFEFFAIRRSPATIQEVAVALAIPHSSVAALLNSLRNRDYLDIDARKTFIPSLKLLRLTDWLIEESTEFRRMYRLLEGLQASTGETVLMASRDGACIRYEQVLPSPEPLRMVIHAGIRRPLHRTASGIVMLAELNTTERTAAVKLSIAEDDDSVDQVVETFFLVDAAQRSGWYESRGRMSPGLSVIATSLGKMPGFSTVTIGVGGPTERIAAKRDEILRALGKVNGKPLCREGRLEARIAKGQMEGKP